MPKAVNLLRASLHYRKAAFDQGLQAAGFEVVAQGIKPSKGDVFLCWNRYGSFNEMACVWEARGGTVVVIENGFLGKAWRGGEWFSIAIGHHSGAGIWKPSGPTRWDGWGVELKPWKTSGRELLIFAQRGIGEVGIASPPNWAERTQKRIGGRIRQHPGKNESTVPLIEDLVDVKQCATWHSAAGFTALIEGVPVWTDYPQWIGAPACRLMHEWPAEPKRDDDARLNMFRSLAWAQWEISEVIAGTPFKHLMG